VTRAGRQLPAYLHSSPQARPRIEAQQLCHSTTRRADWLGDALLPRRKPIRNWIACSAKWRRRC